MRTRMTRPAVMAAASPLTWRLGMRSVKSSLGSTAGGAGARVPVAGGEAVGVEGSGDGVVGVGAGCGAGVGVGVGEGAVVLVRGGAVWLAGVVVVFVGGAVSLPVGGAGCALFVVGGGAVWFAGGAVALPSGAGAVAFVEGAVALWVAVAFAGCGAAVGVVSAWGRGMGSAWARWAPRRVTRRRMVRRVRMTRMGHQGARDRTLGGC
ncbi:MAG: hypothetical protein QOI63_1971 [Thermoplasmata archaeon]|jgi:hypothetical protein|nr:hypothetical protein [Thermoplasmata archaeon]